MSTILEGKSIATALKAELHNKAQTIFSHAHVYMAIIFLGENKPSSTYVQLKRQFGRDIGIPVEVFGQDAYTEFDHLRSWKEKQYNTEEDVIELITFLNQDSACVGLIVQLPLPDHLWAHHERIMAHIDPRKDVDALGGKIYGMASFGILDFLGATPYAAIYLLQQYEIAQFAGKIVTVIGQSNLTGKPIASYCMQQGATVLSCNKDTPLAKIQHYCQESDYIFSCTGHVHLVNADFVRDDQTQIIVDIGYGYKDGKPVGDVDLDSIKDKVKAYTPVPGGVGPLTVACLFHNIFVLQKFFSS